MYNVHTMYKHVYTNYKVYTHTHSILIHVSVHTCLELVHTLYMPSTYMECTSTSIEQKVAWVRDQTHVYVLTAKLP